MSEVRAELADVLRGRILRGLQGGALKSGDRLPSARELETEFGMDHRIVLDSYRLLVEEEVVEMRPRGGIYVAATAGGGAVPMPSAVWLAEVMAQGLAREIPLTELHEWLHRAIGTLRLRAVVVQSTADQVEGICRELREDYGLEASGLKVSELAEASAGQELRLADVLVTSEELEEQVRPAADALKKPVLLVDIRPDLIAGEWRLLLSRPVYVVVADEQFVDMLLGFFSETPGVENLRPVVVGRDDLSVIPDGAPVYITQSARQRLAGVQIRGRILPTARLFSAASSLSLIRFIVSANLNAFAHRWPPQGL